MATKIEFVKTLKEKLEYNHKHLIFGLAAAKDIVDYIEKELSLEQYPDINGNKIYGVKSPIFKDDTTLGKIKDLVLSEEDKFLMEKGKKFDKLTEILKSNVEL